MPKKEMFTSRFEETRGGRVPQKSKILGDVFYGWSLRVKTTADYMFFQITRHSTLKVGKRLVDCQL